jgi:hypothetical protein
VNEKSQSNKGDYNLSDKERKSIRNHERGTGQMKGTEKEK